MSSIESRKYSSGVWRAADIEGELPGASGELRIARWARVVATLALAVALLIFPGIERRASAEEQSSKGFARETPNLARSAERPLPPGQARLGGRLARLLDAGTTGELPIRVTLRYHDLPPPSRARAAGVLRRRERVLELPAMARAVRRRNFEQVPGFAAVVSREAIEALRTHPDVLAVHLDGELRKALVEGRALMGADTLIQLGLRGTGINVAILDTGIDTDHPDLIASLVAEQCFCDIHPSPQMGGCCPGNSDTASGPGASEDGDGHGTSVAGIITSDGVAAAAGVARGAGIIAVKVLSDTGVGSSSDTDAALDWVLQNHAALGIRVVNMSLADGGEFDSSEISNCSTTPTAVAIASLAAVGVTVVVASGNDGHDAGISAPACVAEAIAVGGVYDAALGGVGWCANASCSELLCSDLSGPDVFVCHTNSGSLLDVLAPDWQTRTSSLGGGAGLFGGTSAASPYVAGLVALMLERSPDLTPAELRAALVGTGMAVTNPDNGLSFPRVASQAALSAALTTCGDGALQAGESCDDGNTVGGDCCSAICTFEPIAAACDDGSLCSSGGLCDGGGVCSGVVVVCADANPCTDDACDDAVGCTFTPNAEACDDGNACTFGDLCGGGACQPGGPLACDDSNVCTDESCEPAVGCVAVANNDPCEDGIACTTGDVCVETMCTSGGSVDCDDGDPCTADACDEVDGCSNAPIAGCIVPVVDSTTSSGLLALAVVLLTAGSVMVFGLDRYARDRRSQENPHQEPIP